MSENIKYRSVLQNSINKIQQSIELYELTQINLFTQEEIRLICETWNNINDTILDINILQAQINKIRITLLKYLKTEMESRKKHTNREQNNLPPCPPLESIT